MNLLILIGIMFFDRTFINIVIFISLVYVGSLIEGYGDFLLLIEKRKYLTYEWIRIILDVSCAILEFFRSLTIRYILKN